MVNGDNVDFNCIFTLGGRDAALHCGQTGFMPHENVLMKNNTFMYFYYHCIIGCLYMGKIHPSIFIFKNPSM